MGPSGPEPGGQALRPEHGGPGTGGEGEAAGVRASDSPGPGPRGQADAHLVAYREKGFVSLPREGEKAVETMRGLSRIRKVVAIVLGLAVLAWEVERAGGLSGGFFCGLGASWVWPVSGMVPTCS